MPTHFRRRHRHALVEAAASAEVLFQRPDRRPSRRPGRSLLAVALGAAAALAVAAVAALAGS